MPKYLVTIRRTSVEHEVVEFTSHSAAAAALKVQNYADDLHGARRGVTVVQKYDEDRKSTELREVVAVKEV